MPSLSVSLCNETKSDQRPLSSYGETSLPHFRWAASRQARQLLRRQPILTLEAASQPLVTQSVQPADF